MQQHGRADHKAALQRRHLIEARKEFLEHRNRTKVCLARGGAVTQGGGGGEPLADDAT